MRKNICILTQQFDPHADQVILRMRERGFAPMRVHLDDVIANDLTVGSDFGESGGGILVTSRRRIRFSDIEAVWWRRPANPNSISSISREANAFVSRELHFSLFSVWFSLDCMWMSNPGCLLRASLKIDQLMRARILGFRIPRTLITNERSEAVDFANRLGGVLLTKPMTDYFHAGFLAREQSGDGAAQKDAAPAKGVYARKISERDIATSTASIANCPCQFQEYIEKAFELRVTVIGDRIFAAKIDSQADSRTKVDWRHYDVPMRLSEYKLPDDIAVNCLKFVASYKLTYGAFDFIVTPEGEYVFLECNPNGQWYFVEHLLPQYKMTDALIDWLTTGDALTQYVDPSLQTVTF